MNSSSGHATENRISNATKMRLKNIHFNILLSYTVDSCLSISVDTKIYFISTFNGDVFA